MTKLLVSGPTGQMGRAVIAAAAEEGAEIVGLITGGLDGEMPDLPRFNTVGDVGDLAADAIIDFSIPAATTQMAKDCAARGLALVTGTTGLSDEQQASVDAVASEIALVQSGNFSLGVNLLLSLVEKAARSLSGFDIEIAETHHRRKIDAPSGTALMLGEAAARGRNGSLQERAVFARQGQAGPRADLEIGFSVLRGGGVRGDHDVHLMAEDEVITLSHRALDRSLFARGALRSAIWAAGQKPGRYSMRDVLDLD